MSKVAGISTVEDFHSLLTKLGWDYHISVDTPKIPVTSFGSSTATYLTGMTTVRIAAEKDGTRIEIERHDLGGALAVMVEKVLKNE